jgi:hypothetical protein
MTVSYESATTRLIQQELGACALIQDLLPLYMDDEVSPGSRELIAEHLARCERCAGFLAGARSMHSQLRREGALRASLAAQDQATRQAVELGRRRLRWLVVGGIGTLFGVGLFVIVVLMLFGIGGTFATAQPVVAPRPMIDAAPLAPGVMVDPRGVPIDPVPPDVMFPSQIDPQTGMHPPEAMPGMPHSSDSQPIPSVVPTVVPPAPPQTP